MLIHWPGVSGRKPSDERNLEQRKLTWCTLECLYEKGLVKCIGVSNYELRHLQEMETYAHTMPHVLQIEIHPYYVPQELIDYCRVKQIRITSYSTFGEGRFLNGQLDVPMMGNIAQKHGVTVAQVLLRWAIQNDFHVIPKASSKLRLRENLDIEGFQLDGDDMRALDELNSHTKFCWDPAVVR